MSDPTFVGPHNIANTYGGWFHVYSFTMFIGIIVSILVSWYKLHRHRIPTDCMVISVIFIIPAALFGASFLGKDDPLNPMPFFDKFKFWVGGLSIHGGVLFGLIAGIIFFGFVSRKTKVSMWVYGDCIIPNILLGQVIGRWGNFFNHELLGDFLGYSSTLDASHIPVLSWLPAFIRDNCFKLVAGSPETVLINGQNMYVFRAPIFLYESLANLTFWILLTFLVPKTFKWFSFKKPWKIEPNRFKLLTTKERLSETNYVLKQNNNSFFANAWQKIKVEYELPFVGTWFKNLALKRKYWQEAFYNQKVSEFEIKNIQENYEIDARNKPIFAYFNRSNALYHLNNPKRYFVMRSGVQMWLYFFGWNLIRFCLELQRSNGADLFIMNRRALDYTVLILIFVIGLIMAILSQFVISRFFRNEQWTYEKEY